MGGVGGSLLGRGGKDGSDELMYTCEGEDGADTQAETEGAEKLDRPASKASLVRRPGEFRLGGGGLDMLADCSLVRG